MAASRKDVRAVSAAGGEALPERVSKEVCRTNHRTVKAPMGKTTRCRKTRAAPRQRSNSILLLKMTSHLCRRVPVYHRPYQALPPERLPTAPEVAYDSEPELPRVPGNTFTFSVAKFNQFLGWLLSVIEVMFALRFFLTFFSTSDSNAFISLLTSITDPLLAPFKTALRVQDTGVEWYILLAMLVYFLAILALTRFLRLFITEPEL